MGDGMFIFLGMVFITVFLLAQGTIVPVFGEARKTRKRLRERLEQIEATSDEGSMASLLREKYLRNLTPIERFLESLPTMEKLRQLIEQAGHNVLAYRLVLLSMLIGFIAGLAAWSYSLLLWAAALAAALGASLPIFKILNDRTKRIAKFEEQLPDAIDMMQRALRAGHPFSATLKLVADDMDEPVSKEFGMAFADINYGNDTRRAMLGLLKRMPSLAVMALVTSVLVQKDTGGNLAEILEQISKVIRGRFRFYRKVKTLSAEGRLSAWILAMVPLVLFVVISFTSPDYLPVLLEDPFGKRLVVFGFVAGIFGILWIRRIIRIEV